MAIKKTNNKSIFNLCILIAIIVLLATFSILSPKISSRIFVQRRTTIWNEFYGHLKVGGNLDPQKFWEFREFYSPGFFTFERKSISKSDTISAIKKIDISPEFIKNQFPFLIYNSERITSIDSLTADNSIEKYFESNKLRVSGEQVRGKNFILIRNKYEALLIFISPEAEMKKANGFFDYSEKDKELVKGKYWLNISKIILY